MHLSPLNRRLHRRHAADRTGGGELLQTPFGGCRPGRTGQWVNDADLPHSLHAAAPPGPPVRAAPAVRQTAELGRRRRRSQRVGPRRNSPGLVALLIFHGVSARMHNLEVICYQSSRHFFYIYD